MARAQEQIRDICDRLSETFQRLVPLHPQPVKGRKRPTEKELKATSERVLQQFLAAAREERSRRSLGVVGQARVAFGLQQRLMKVGYPPPLVKQVLFAMLASAFVGGKK